VGQHLGKAAAFAKNPLKIAAKCRENARQIEGKCATNQRRFCAALMRG